MDLDLDLNEVENLASGTEARSSRFNPRLQPRARPVRNSSVSRAFPQAHWASAPSPPPRPRQNVPCFHTTYSYALIHGRAPAEAAVTPWRSTRQ